MALIKNQTKIQRILKKATKFSLAIIANDMFDQYCAEDLGLSDEEFEIMLDQLNDIVHELCGSVEPAGDFKDNIELAKKIINHE